MGMECLVQMQGALAQRTVNGVIGDDVLLRFPLIHVRFSILRNAALYVRGPTGTRPFTPYQLLGLYE